MKLTSHSHAVLILGLFSAVLSPLPVPAIIADPKPATFLQPDGTSVVLQQRGDEFFHWLEDLQGFTVQRDGEWLVYSVSNTAGQLTPSSWRVGLANPRELQLAPRQLPPLHLRQQNKNFQLPAYRPWEQQSSHQSINPIGNVQNVVILCRFSDHTLGVHTRAEADYNVLFNQVGGDPVLAPTGSVRDYFTEASFGKLTLQSTVLAWVTLPQTMAYYCGTNNGVGQDYPNNAQRMVEDALSLADPLVNFGNFDQDNDGYVDLITIIHSGYGAETAGAPDNSIWSHRGDLNRGAVINDWTSADNNSAGVKVKVNSYHTEPALWGTTGSDILRIGVVAHEIGHFFGLPDLYDTDGNSSGVGCWCLMGDSWGFAGDQLRPSHPSAWAKIKLGWIQPTEAVAVGNYLVPAAETSHQAIKITRGYPPGEYLLIENRQPVGMDSNIPQGGLAIWHIDEAVPCGCNTNAGYLGQPDWPANGKHYMVALVQADGVFQLEILSGHRGDASDLFHAGGVSKLTPTTVPSSNGYQDGNMCIRGVTIANISASSTLMSFDYSFYGRVHYVDKAYVGTSDGTCSRPYKTLTEAHAAAVDGDAIEIRGGTYPETTLTEPDLPITLNKRVDIYSYTPPVIIK